MISTTDLPVQTRRIQATSGWRSLDLREVFKYRELLWILALKDIRVRYKQTVFGFLWAILQPVSQTIIFTTFFGYLAGMSHRLDAGVSYPLYAFAGLMPWQLFSSVLSQSSGSIVANRGLLTKVYFPRILLPMVSLPCSLVDLGIQVVLMGALMAHFHTWPGLQILMLPVFICLALATALAVSLWLSALNALYRDVQQMIPFLTQLWLFLTPVVYPSAIVPSGWRLVYGLNPMVGVVEGFRWALLGGHPPEHMMVLSIVVVLLLLVTGMYQFRRMERIFADIV